MDVTLGYAYNGRGITKQEMQQFSTGVAALNGKSNPNYAIVMNSTLDLGYSPLKYVRELALINLTIPQVTEYLTFNTANFISLDDGSCETNLFLEYTINDWISMEFTGMFRFGDQNSIFGSAFKKSSIGLQLKLIYYFQEDKGFRVALARNEGIRRAHGRVLIFLDTGMIVGTSFIRKHFECYYNPRNPETCRPIAVIGYVYGYDYNRNSGLLREIDFENHHQDIILDWKGFNGAAVSSKTKPKQKT